MDVLDGQVGGPETAGCGAEAEVDVELIFRLLEVQVNGGGIEAGGAFAIEEDVFAAVAKVKA